nr:MAG TPA: hypothetical protein [Caudoviricetes sp.]
MTKEEIRNYIEESHCKTADEVKDLKWSEKFSVGTFVTAYQDYCWTRCLNVEIVNGGVKSISFNTMIVDMFVGQMQCQHTYEFNPIIKLEST